MIWDQERRSKAERMEKAAGYARGKRVGTEEIVPFLESVIRPGDRVVLEGCNQKQAAFLAGALKEVNQGKVHDLNMIIPSISRDEHLDLFDRGIASEINFSFAGVQSRRLAEMVAENTVKIGAIHTYLELYGRLYVDLTPNVCLIAADKADSNGNLYTGYNTEETPILAEAAAFKNGIVVAQVNEIVGEDDLPRVDIPGGWVDYIVKADEPYPMEPLFTRDPARIQEAHILMGMMTIKGIYAKHGVKSLNHGIGYNGAAIELLLPTFGDYLGLKGKICTNWVLNPHPTLIPAVEAGWVKQVCAFGGELGMERYTAARPDIFFTGKDGMLRSNRAAAQVAGLYGIDLFLGGTLQMDYEGNSSTVTGGRLSGFGGAPNMGNSTGYKSMARYGSAYRFHGLRAETGGSDDKEPEQIRPGLCSGAGCRENWQKSGYGCGSRHGLWRGCDACGDRAGNRLPVSGSECGGAHKNAGLYRSGNAGRLHGGDRRDRTAAQRRKGGLSAGSCHFS